MTSFWLRRLVRKTWHPSFEELMLSLDEPRFKMSKVEAHLKSCWSCRHMRRKVDRVISAYMDARNTSLAGSSGFPKHALPAFERRLDRLALESGRPAIFPSFLRELVQVHIFSRHPFRLATFLGCLLLMTLVFFRLTSAPPVSAKEVLYRVRQAEDEQLKQTPLPVIHEKLRLRRDSTSVRSELITWEIWTDTRSKCFRHRVEDSQGLRILSLNNRKQVEFKTGEENHLAARNTPQSDWGIERVLPAVFSELEQLFRSHRADFEHPLSPDSFEAWSHAIDNGSEEALQGKLTNGDEAFVLRASGEGPFLQNSIMSAELTVRKRDWRPVEARLQVKAVEGTTSYTIGEVTLEAIAFNLVPPSIFGESTVISAMPHRVAQPTTIPAKDRLPTESDLIAAEVEAWYGIHSAGMCLGRPMTVVRIGHNHVEVQGIVEDAESKTQLLTALRGIPYVTSSLRTLAEDLAANSTQRVHPVAGETVESRTYLTSGALPKKLAAEDPLEKFFAANDCAGVIAEERAHCIQQKIAQLSQGVLKSSETALAQAWALRQLAEWYSSKQQDSLRISSRRLVGLMVQDHLAALSEEWGRLRTLMTFVLGSVVDNPGLSSRQHEPHQSIAPITGSANWVATFHSLCSTVERTTNLMIGMFVETNFPVTDTERAAKELSSAIASLDADFVKLEAQVAVEFAGASKVMANSKPGQQ